MGCFHFTLRLIYRLLFETEERAIGETQKWTLSTQFSLFCFQFKMRQLSKIPPPGPLYRDQRRNYNDVLLRLFTFISVHFRVRTGLESRQTDRQRSGTERTEGEEERTSTRKGRRTMQTIFMKSYPKTTKCFIFIKAVKTL